MQYGSVFWGRVAGIQYGLSRFDGLLDGSHDKTFHGRKAVRENECFDLGKRWGFSSDWVWVVPAWGVGQHYQQKHGIVGNAG